MATARRTPTSTTSTTHCSRSFTRGRLINRYRIDFLSMEADVNTPHLRARLENQFPKFGADMLKTVGIGEFTAGDSAIIGAATPAWQNGTKLITEAG